MYRIALLSDAEKSFRRIFETNKKLFRRIDNAMQALRSDPFMGRPLKDNLKGKFSLRVGVYRIIYMIEKHGVVIYVLDIGHRGDVYR